jgi:hypothetical protein
MAKKYPSIADDRRQPIVARVAPVIPRTGAWSGDNQLGGVVPFQRNARATQTILKMDEWGPPELWTISLCINERPASDLFLFDVEAEINFGVGGATQTLKCDWNVGTQVTVVMNAVNVIARYRGVSIGIAEDSMKLSVQIGRGARPMTGIPPIYTVIKGENLLTTEAVRADLPNFTKSVRLMASSLSAPGGVTATQIANVFADDVIVTVLDKSDSVMNAYRGSDFLRMPSLPANTINVNVLAELAA